MHQSVRKRNNRIGKLWLAFFKMHMEWIFIDYLEKGRTITGAYYAALLNRLADEVRKKRPYLKKKKIIFHDDTQAQAKKHELDFESLPHPPYSPDLAPSNYYLFSNLEKWLRGRRFESKSEEVEWEK